MQQRIGRIEAASALVRQFHPALVLGLLQTPDYIRALLGEGLTEAEVEQMVVARIDRQQLLDTNREFVLVMTEGALRWQLGSPSVMTDQLSHLAEITRRGNVRLGVIPWTTPVRVAALHGFHLYDQRAAIVGTETATAVITDPVTSRPTKIDSTPLMRSRYSMPTHARSSTGSDLRVCHERRKELM